MALRDEARVTLLRVLRKNVESAALLHFAGDVAVQLADEPLALEPGGRHGAHSTDFTDELWPELTGLYREHRGVRW